MGRRGIAILAPPILLLFYLFQAEVVGARKCFQSMSKNHELEFDHPCDVENRYIYKGGHGRITSESCRWVLEMLSIDI